MIIRTNPAQNILDFRYLFFELNTSSNLVSKNYHYCHKTINEKSMVTFKNISKINNK